MATLRPKSKLAEDSRARSALAKPVAKPGAPPASKIIASVAAELPAILTPEADGGYSAEVPALPGCHSEGDTLEEVLANIKGAAEGWLLVNHDRETGASAIGPAPR